MMARELLNLVGLNINWVVEPVANCHRTGNHLGIQPHTFKDNIEFLVEERTVCKLGELVEEGHIGESAERKQASLPSAVLACAAAVAVDGPSSMSTGSMRIEPKAMCEAERQTGTNKFAHSFRFGTSDR